MVVDSSAILAIILREPEAEKFAALLRNSRMSIMAAPSLLEACMASTRLIGKTGVNEVRLLVKSADIEIAAFGSSALDVAVDAFLKYGKGQGHPAQLNFGDCISYATSKVEAMPLLFKGDDFRLTDVECAI